MTSTYKFIDHTADIAVEVSADTIEELFSVSLIAYNEAVIEGKIYSSDAKIITINSNSIEELLVTFLNEINFMLIIKKIISVELKNIDIDQSQSPLIGKFEIGIAEMNESIILKEEIKSITYHQMNIQKINGKFTTKIIFDI